MYALGPQFFGRDHELAFLRSQIDRVRTSGTGRILAVRGRRQVGKSTTIERFVETSTVPYVFVSGVFQASVRQQISDATTSIVESRHPLPDAQLFTETTAESWRDWFNRIALAARFGPVIVVLDEFLWLTAADPTLEGTLQSLWDRTLEKLPVLLILIGSDVAMMEHLAEHGRPLFGRVRPWVIPALNPAEVGAAVPGWSAVDVFDAYLITGGYPRLVADLTTSGAGSAVEYVRSALVDVYSPLVSTGRITLDAEFPDSRWAYQVLSAIGANGTAHPSFTDILSTIADPTQRQSAQTAITRSLRVLRDHKHLIEQETPAWSKASTKVRQYRVTDPYLRFWFRFVEQQTNEIARGRADLAVARFDRDWSSWRGRSIEPVVRQSLTKLALDNSRLVGVERVDSWWTRTGDAEVDVVATTATATALVGTIKWRPMGPVTAAEMVKLRRDCARIPHSEQSQYAAISPTKHRPNGADVAFSAADLLAAWG